MEHLHPPGPSRVENAGGVVLFLNKYVLLTSIVGVEEKRLGRERVLLPAARPCFL